jgi:colicin import membrane protein
MVRKLKTYQTSLGFFDQAVAAPSMKAALEAWGANSNLFHQGVARETNDPAVVAATMSHPGVVHMRPVGSNGPFVKHAELPTYRSSVGLSDRPGKRLPKATTRPPRNIDPQATRQAALAFEKAERKRERQRQKEEIDQAKQRERRQQAVAKAQAALEKAKREHDARASAIESERAALEKRSQTEEARWEKQKEKLEIALRRAGG